jgi:hypothetical protein
VNSSNGYGPSSTTFVEPQDIIFLQTFFRTAVFIQSLIQQRFIYFLAWHSLHLNLHLHILLTSNVKHDKIRTKGKRSPLYFL